MKRLVLATLLVLCFPLASLADRVDFSNSNGTLTGSDKGFTLQTSTLTVINILGQKIMTGDNLGTVHFDTGGGIAGNLNTTETFKGGGDFAISNTGGHALIFVGAFSDTVTWHHVKNDIYELSGPVSGTWTLANGVKLTVTGYTTQLYFGTIVNGVFTGTLGSGNTLLETPEPDTLGLLGSGLVVIGAIIRRKQHTPI
jgi:hypothetical protein